jgi:hypothetical protein
MKRIVKNVFLILLATTFPLALASGQEKKSEQKVKVMITDKDGNMTQLDTTFNGDSMPDSIALKNGKVVYFAHGNSDMPHLKVDGGKGNIYVTCTIDDDGEKSTDGKVIIMSGDKMEWTVAPSTGSKEHVYIQTSDGEESGKTVKHVVVSSAVDGDALWQEKDGKKVIVLKEGISDSDGKTIHVKVDSDNDTETDMTKYVIAKDGVVVTVESNDEAKAKEIISTIEAKLDAKTDTGKKQDDVKSEPKKSVKK